MSATVLLDHGSDTVNVLGVVIFGGPISCDIVADNLIVARR